MKKSFSKPKRLLACFVSAALTLNLLTTTALSENVYEESESTVYEEPQTDAVLDETSAPETLAVPKTMTETLSALETQTPETDIPETETSVEFSSETETQAETTVPESETSPTEETAPEENITESETAAQESFSEMETSKETDTELPTEEQTPEPSSESDSPEETEIPESEAPLTEEVLPEEVSTETELLEDLNLPASLEDHADAIVEPLVQNLENAASYTVSFDSKGGSAVDSQTVASGETAVKPADPTIDVYTFIGWYSDEALTSVYNFDTPVTGNITLYAKWGIPINRSTFPDSNFGDLVSADFDKNSDDFLDVAELRAVTDIKYVSRSITSLKGIEYFTALITLNCNYNQLTSLDLSANTALTSLKCTSNELASLNVTKNTALTTLDCHGNQLSSLDITKNTALTVLDCSNNQLSSLDLSANTALTSLHCSINQLSSLDLSANTALTSLSCNSSQLSSLDLGTNTALADLTCSNNQLSSLDLSANTALTFLRCNYNQLSSLDLSANTALADLTCSNNQLSSLDLRANTALTRLGCSNNRLTSLDLRANTALTSLYCTNNQLISLNLGANTALAGLDCSNNQLTSLDLSTAAALSLFYCYNNQLTSLNLSANTVLTILSCSNNQLSSLDLSANTALTRLDCSNNRLTSLDLSANTALVSFTCINNQLTSLDLSKNAALEGLYCSNNQLTNLDINATSIVNQWVGDSQTYSISIGIDRQFDLSSLPGSFDISKASRWNGGTVNGTILTADDDVAQVTYFYDVGKSKTIDVTLNIVQKDCIITFESNGGTPVSSQIILSGESALKPADPTMDVYTFVGWYSDEALTSAYDFNTPVTGNITLYAKWGIPVNGTTFPDSNFRDLVSADFDKNSDGFLSAAEIGAVTDIRCRWQCIASLKGIEYFTSLQTLDCYSNQLTSLDLSANTALTTLNCGNNWLTSLNVSANTALTNLDCYNNELTFLELSANTALTSLDCSKNQLTSLDLSANMALTALDCRNNQLASLDLSSNTSLTSFNCNGNQLASLDLSANTALTTLYCNNNQLDSLDVSKNAALISLNCRGNQLTSLDLSQNTALEWLYCDNNHLTSLDISAASIVTWYGSPQSYTITVNFDRKFDLSSLPGSFDVSKASGWDGGTINGTTLTVDDDAAQVTYSYDVGNSKTMDVTLNVIFNYCTVTFDSNGGSSVDSQSVIKGGHATEPENPLKTCSALVGWCTDSGLTDVFDFNTPILTDMTLYAKWTDSHTPGTAVKEKETAPSCTEDGSYENVVFCTVCSTELSRDTVIVPATGHNWNNGVVTLEPTTEAEGVRTYTCSLCGNTRTETIAKLPPETEAPTEPVETETETKAPEAEEPKETETETESPETEKPAETETETPITEEPAETETETKAPETEKPKETETSSIGEPPETEPETHETETETVTPETEKPAETESETETKAPAASGTSQTPTPPDASPKTGDETRLDLWFALMAVSLAGFAGILFTGKRRKKDR